LTWPRRWLLPLNPSFLPPLSSQLLPPGNPFVSSLCNKICAQINTSFFVSFTPLWNEVNDHSSAPELIDIFSPTTSPPFTLSKHNVELHTVKNRSSAFPIRLSNFHVLYLETFHSENFGEFVKILVSTFFHILIAESSYSRLCLHLASYFRSQCRLIFQSQPGIGQCKTVRKWKFSSWNLRSFLPRLTSQKELKYIFSFRDYKVEAKKPVKWLKCWFDTKPKKD